MTLIEPGQGPRIEGLEVPSQFYWVLTDPAPLAGMRAPANGWPWQALHETGFDEVVALEPGSYDPSPLVVSFAERLEDLVHGGPPQDELTERDLVGRAVTAVISGLRNGRGVLVHCHGGRGRTGTVLGCVLRELGFPAGDVLLFLDRVHKARGKPGWPESGWQRRLVQSWVTTA